MTADVTTTVSVMGPSPYPVIVGHALDEQVGRLVAGASTVLVVVDERLAGVTTGVENVE